MKGWLIIILINISFHSMGLGIDTLEVADYRNDWLFFKGDHLLPLVEYEDFEGDAIRFSLEKEKDESTFLSVKYPYPFSIFVENKLIKTGQGSVNLKLNQFVNSHNDQNITIYAHQINPYLLETKQFRTIEQSDGVLDAEVIIINPINHTWFKDFYTMAILIVAIFSAVIITYYPRLWKEYFQLSRALSARELDENLMKSRIFTGSNLLIYLYISLILSLLIMSVVALAGIYPEQILLHPETPWGAIGNWMVISVIVFLIIIIKYITIYFFSGLFSVGDFINNHFYNFLRLIFIITIVYNLLLAAIFFIIYPYANSFYLHFQPLLLYSIIPIIFIIYLKLMNASSFKKVHLFSYICGTELVPYFLILSIGMK